MIGNEVYTIFLSSPKTYENTCAIRMSYALNYGGMPITKVKNETKILSGDDKKLYLFGIQDIRDFLYVKWGFEKPYNPKNMYSKEDNRVFKNELLSFGKNGIVVMQVSGWGNAYGHTTLWSGEEQRFIDGTDYLLDDRDNVIVTKFYFWELNSEKDISSNTAIV